MRKIAQTKASITFVLLAVTAWTASCKDVDDAVEECDDCVSNGHNLWACYDGDSYRGTVCEPLGTPTNTILYDCQAAYGGPFWTADNVEKVPCDGAATAASQSDCEDWNPSAAITEVATKKYEIEESFVNYILADPMRAANCDTGILEFDFISGNFFVDGADNGSLLYELGFRDGDRIFEVNGETLNTREEALERFGVLHDIGETEFEFVADHNNSDVVIQIDIVP